MPTTSPNRVARITLSRAAISRAFTTIAALGIVVIALMAAPIAWARPAAPTLLSAAAGDTKVTLTWTSVSGAVTYNVRRSLTAGGPYTTLPVWNITGTSYTDSGLSNGTTYYYVVMARDSANAVSVNSNELAATPTPPLAAPSNFTATAGGNQVTLSWSAVTGATSYQATATPGGATVTTSSTSAIISATILGLTNGTPYTFSLVAKNSTSTSSAATATATPNWPDATNTGWQHTGVTLTPYTGPMTITTDGKHIDAQDISGCMVINAKDVVITRSRFSGACSTAMLKVTGPSDNNPNPDYSVRVYDTEFDGLNKPIACGCVGPNCYTPASKAMDVANVNASGNSDGSKGSFCVRCNMHSASNGMGGSGTFTLQDSYVHDLFFYHSQCGVDDNGTHNQDVKVNSVQPGSVIKVFHSRLENPLGQTSAVSLFNDFSTIHDVTVDNNLVGGGDYVIYGGCMVKKDSTKYGVTHNGYNVVFTNNRFLRSPTGGFFPEGGSFGPLYSLSLCTTQSTGTGNVWNNNVWDDNGAPVP